MYSTTATRGPPHFEAQLLSDLSSVLFGLCWHMLLVTRLGRSKPQPNNSSASLVVRNKATNQQRQPFNYYELRPDARDPQRTRRHLEGPTAHG